jgi:cell division protein FtsZ
MKNSGVSIMGSGCAQGPDRAIRAIEDALTSPLLNNNDIRGAKNILLNITSGADEITMDEVGQISDYIQAAAGSTADIIWGNGIDESLGDKINVTIIATGFGMETIPEFFSKNRTEKEKFPLGEKEKFYPPKPSEQKPVEVFTLEANDKKQVAQATISFDENPEKEKEIKIEEKPNTETTASTKSDDKSTLIKNYEKLRQLSLYHTNNKNIDDLETEPAYMRKNINIDNTSTPSTEKVYSDSSLKKDENGVKLSTENPYINPIVD